MAIPIHNHPPRPTPVRAHHGPPQSWLGTHAPNWTLAALRVIAGLMLVQHGAQKLFGVLQMPNIQMPNIEPLSMLWFAAALELVGGVLIALGLFTRVVGFILSGEMAVAYFIAHAKNGLFPAVNGGELAVLYCFIFLGFAGLGGGAYSLDQLIATRRNRPKLAT